MTQDQAPTTGLQASLFLDLPAGAKARGSAFASAQPRRIDVLRERLPDVMHLVARRRMDLVEEGFVADYLALRWIEWRAGELSLTAVGRVVHDSNPQR